MYAYLMGRQVEPLAAREPTPEPEPEPEPEYLRFLRIIERQREPKKV
jgi:hypothetical protein